MRRHCAFTLIELLAVIVIASLVTAMGAISMGGVMRQTQFQRTIAALADLDARARMHARSSGAAMLVMFDSERRQVTLTRRGLPLEDPVTRLSVVDVPGEIDLQYDMPHQRHTAILFDRLGTSIDYAVEVRDAISARRLEFAGLSGDVKVTEVAP